MSMSEELSAKECKQLKYNPEKKKLNYLRDGKSLYLEVLPNGRKVWRLEFWLDKKSRITFPIDYGKKGSGLKAVRKWARKQRKIVGKGHNPTIYARQKEAQKLEKKRNKEAKKLAKKERTFDAVADAWLKHHEERWSSGYYRQAESVVRRVLRPTFGEKAITDIKTKEILSAVESYQAQGKNYSAKKALELTSQIYRYAETQQLGVKFDPTYSLRGSEGLKPTKSTNQPHLTNPEEVGELLKKIDGYNPRHFAASYCLRILPYVFTRPSELRLARWREFDFENARWDVPEERMKGRRPHVVPLATQVVVLLEELATYSHHSTDSLLFPSPRNQQQPITDATLSKALRSSLGYEGRQVPHGFRHTASTLLNETQLFSIDAIEMQQAHGDRNSVRGIYNKAQFLPERRKMMQFYAEYLDGLKSGKPVNVVSLKSNQK